MLQLFVKDETNALSAGQLEKALADAAPLLDACRAGHAQYADSLGWLRVEEWAGEQKRAEIKARAQSIRRKADAFVLIGVGGSNNAARAVLRALEPAGPTQVLWAGNTLSAWEFNRLLEQLEGRQVYIDCVAKNFETLEPGSAFRVLRQYLKKRYGEEEAARRILCTGTPGSQLDDLCRREGYAFLPFPPNIGGRFTALSGVHLLPMAVAGVDIDELAWGAAAMEQQLRTQPAGENIALRYAVLRWLYGRKGYKAEMLSAFEPRLAGFFQWWQQLFAESEGKQGKGLLPVTGEYSEQLHSLGQFVQEGTPLLFETFLDVKEPGTKDSLVIGGTDVADGFGYLDGKDFWQVNRASFEATRAAHSQVLPCLTLAMDRLDAFHMGQLFYFFAFACYLSAELLGVNPFDQPGVEAYKQRMFRALGR